MKYIYKLFLAVSLIISIISCTKDEPYVEPQIDITQDNILGKWQLSHINDNEIEGDNVYFYIDLYVNDEGVAEFEIYENMASSFANYEKGTFKYDADVNTICGEYSLSYGTKWANSYNITGLTAVNMDWTIVDDSEVQTFVRVSTIPKDILNGSRSMQEDKNVI